MTRFHHILVPVDFEEGVRGGTRDGDWARAHVRREADDPSCPGEPDLSLRRNGARRGRLGPAIERVAKEHLDTTRAQARKSLPRAESILANGATASELLRAIDQTKADLVVMGTHGRRGLSRGLLGSVAESVDDSLTRLMRRRPTLASGARARASVEARAHGTADALHPTMIPRHILAPIDFDDTSDRALDLAAELAKAFGASLTILHTVDIPPYAYANFGAALPPPDLLGILEHHAREALDGRLRKVQTAIPEAKVILTTGVPWREILAAVDRVSADMVVLGTQRHGWLEHALLGSVAEKIVRASPVPVLTVPPSRKQS